MLQAKLYPATCSFTKDSVSPLCLPRRGSSFNSAQRPFLSRFSTLLASSRQPHRPGEEGVSLSGAPLGRSTSCDHLPAPSQSGWLIVRSEDQRKLRVTSPPHTHTQEGNTLSQPTTKVSSSENRGGVRECGRSKQQSQHPLTVSAPPTHLQEPRSD